MTRQKRQCFDIVMIFVLITLGICFGVVSFGAEHWVGTLLFLIIGAVLVSSGMTHLIMRLLTRNGNVDDSKE